MSTTLYFYKTTQLLIETCKHGAFRKRTAKRVEHTKLQSTELFVWLCHEVVLNEMCVISLHSTTDCQDVILQRRFFLLGSTETVKGSDSAQDSARGDPEAR